MKSNKKSFIEDLFDAEYKMSYEEGEWALKIAKKHKMEVPFLLKLIEVCARTQKMEGHINCYVWSQTLFEIGLNYQNGKKLTKKDVEQRLDDAEKCSKQYNANKSTKEYWENEKKICHKMLALGKLK